MFCVKPDIPYGLTVIALTAVPVPGVNPAIPHSMFHEVAVPFSVQPKSAEVSVRLVASKLIGNEQVGPSSIQTSAVPFCPSRHITA